jgi:hypothetical protein
MSSPKPLEGIKVVELAPIWRHRPARACWAIGAPTSSGGSGLPAISGAITRKSQYPHVPRRKSVVRYSQRQ